jgi:hypothetical protein
MDHSNLPCRDGNKCRVASEWGQLPVIVSEEACDVCLKQDKPCQKNEVTSSLVFATATVANIKLSNDLLKEVQDHLAKLEYPMEGTGAELTKLLSWFKFMDSDQCLCKQRAILMNSWGCAKCAQEIPIILEWLRASAEQLGIIYFDIAARIIVQKAIANARANGSCKD